MRLAEIKDGVIVNIIEVDPAAVPEWATDWPEAGVAGPGWRADGRDFTAPDVDLRPLRATTSVSKREFCLALLDSDVFDIEEVEAIASGKWPEALQDFLLVLTPRQVASLRIEWAASSIIERMNPVVLTLASYLSLRDELVDTLFGIGMQEAGA